jgi:RNA polymerase sigma-70 factor (ECF subfamily)
MSIRSRFTDRGVLPNERTGTDVELNDLVIRAQGGDLEAFARLVERTQSMAYAVAKGVLRDSGLAEDAAQEAYVRAFRRLRDLDEPAGFIVWLRRIVITSALNMRRRRRVTFLELDDAVEVPVLDEAEVAWSDAQRQRLAAALLILTREQRQLCDRRYHGRWSTARLASEAGVDEQVMRKRLQRVRDKLRREIEVAEQRGISAEEIRPDFPAKVVELLARPQLTDLPENPVGKAVELLRTAFPECEEIALPEIVDVAEAAETIGNDLLYVPPGELHRIDERRILRYDLTMPLLMNVKFEGQPLRLWAAGKAYRLGRLDATHLEAFHQAEVFCLDRRDRLDPWRLTAQVLQSLDTMLPGRAVKIVPTQYPMCSQAWDLEVDDDGQWMEVLALGVFTDKIVRHLGGDPERHTAMGVGYGLERMAMLRWRIDDIRKVDEARVA